MSRRPNEQVVVVFGEVLADRFPDGSEALGGASFNVAWNLQGLGAEPYLVSRVGDDPLGSRILEAMAAFAAAVVGLRGATVTERAFYDRFASQWRDS